VTAPLLEVEGLVKRFTVSTGLGAKEVVHAVDGLSLAVTEGETLALVGESGCGKSTLARCIVRLLSPTEGTISFAGRDITSLPERELRPLRAELQMVFQDPYDSLNPTRRVERIVGDPLRAHGVRDRDEVAGRVADLLARVGLDRDAGRRYPSQFSGGQRQRIGIARALALRPRLVVADEPVSALDVSIQAQVINLMLDLQEDFALTYIVISHDLGLVRHVADRIGVMYLGKLVELSPSDDLYAQPVHPYTEALLAAAPVPDPDAPSRPRIELRGDPPSATNPPPGCRFHTRCIYATDICAREEPRLVDQGGGRMAACHHPLPHD
jgi:oligopeptide/dipeptide ABC transporter ATP-binding protein